ncbi:deoxyribodipyrimidine photo-lyase [Donghicola sp. C2-DW-16]|uniref:Deoxyribodipyrimidine photo-lyase n=1 Tax=Donghicola mangrovi TaxID=2729614 RepID=A0ABX2PH75_9RHOB|nr:deoxyribodipyrimidine photo-lyase [Donghicola mangrovi]
MAEHSPIIVWFRRDLRLSDHPALWAAMSSGRPVVPVFIRDGLVDGLGAAPKWRLGLGVGHLAESLEAIGSKLVLRSGDALTILKALIEETGADTVLWSRAYDPESVKRDKDVKSALKEAGIDAQSHLGHLMFEPWTVETGQGGFYKVFTPFWKSVRGRDVPEPLGQISSLTAPQEWPETEKLEDWGLGAAMRRGADVVRPFVRLGEDAAQDRLAHFIENIVDDYDTKRDLPSEDGTSCLSENLALGEISPRQCWHAAMRRMNEGSKGAETFMKELAWREFAYHLIWHTPRIATDNWREEWSAFPWNEKENAEVTAWKQGRTGIQFVDAAMRELYVTGRMHNRARMIVASYLTKHLLTHWKIGLEWFEDCLIDWDPAANAMGWQWSAGSGPDATPYFRVFNPVTQLDKFDKQRSYVSRWIAEGRSNPHKDALKYFDAIPLSWDLSPKNDYPKPIVTADAGRERALDAYEARDF